MEEAHRANIMKTAATLRQILALVLTSTLAHAATQTYDVASGVNVWDTSTSNWDGSTLPWTNGNDALFAGTGEQVTVNSTISAGIVTFSSNGYELVNGGGFLSLANPTVMSADTGISAIIGETFAGASKLTKAGAGTITLNNAAGNGGALAGGVEVAAGRLILSRGAVFDAGYFDGATALTIKTGAVLEVATSWTVRSSNLVMIDGGTLNFSLAGAEPNANYVNSITSINGTVNGNAFRTGNNTLATHTFSGDTGNTISASMGMVKNGPSQTVRLSVADGAAAHDLAVSGVVHDVSGFGGSTLEKTGAGTLLLSGANTYTGNTLVSAGILKMGNKNAMGAFLAGRPVTQVTVASGAAVEFNGVLDAVYGYTIAGTGVGGTGALINTGAAIGNGTAQTTNIKLSADATVGGSGNWALLAAGYGATSLDLNGFTLTKAGANTISLVSATTTAGTVNVAAGVLALGGGSGGTGVAGAASAVVLNNTAGVSLSVVRDSAIGSLAGGGAAGGTVSIATGVKLTVGALGTDTTQAGVISGAGGLEKTGTGILTLSGANSYSGPTLVSGGTLKIGHQLALGAYQAGRPVTQVTVASGAAIEFNGVGDATYGYTIAGSGVGGTGALVNTGGGINNNLAQTSNIKLSADAAIGGTGNWALLTNGYGATTLDLNGQTLTKTGANNIFLVNSTVTAGTVRVSSGTLWLGISENASSINASAANFVADSGGTLRVFRPSTLGSLTLNGGTLNTAQNLANNITLNNTANVIAPDGAYRVLSGQLTGSGGFTVASGGGVPGLELNNPANNFAGNVTINNGTFLRLSAEEVLPNTATLTINAGGNLRFDVTGGGTETVAGLGGGGDIWVPAGNSAMHTLAVGAGDTSSSFAGAIGQATQNNAFLSLVKTGAGTLTLTGSSLFSGGTTVNGGTLLLNRNVGWDAGNAQAIGTGDITVNSGAILRNGADHSIWGGHQNTRTVFVNNGTVDMAVGQEYFYKLQMTAGTLQNIWIRVGSAVGAGEITTLASATPALINTGIDMTFGSLTFNVADGAAAGDLSIAFPISENSGAGSGAKSLTKNGAGTLTLSGNSTYTGTTTVNAGTLVVNGTHVSTAGLIQVEAGASIGGSGTTGDVALADGATFAPGNSAGVFTVRDLYLSPNSILAFELGAPNLDANPGSDRIDAQQFLQLDGILNITPISGFNAPALVSGDRWLLMTHAPGNVGNSGLEIGSAPALNPGLAFGIDTSINGNVYLAVVPEAGTGALVLLGLAALARRRRL